MEATKTMCKIEKSTNKITCTNKTIVKGTKGKVNLIIRYIDDQVFNEIRKRVVTGVGTATEKIYIRSINNAKDIQNIIFYK